LKTIYLLETTVETAMLLWKHQVSCCFLL